MPTNYIAEPVSPLSPHAIAGPALVADRGVVHLSAFAVA